MQIQTVFKAGNSNTVVSIPKSLSDELGIKTGQKVFVDKSADGDIIIKKVQPKNKKSSVSKTKKEFNKWLKNALEEDKEILNGLASR
ncbi:hypothetical protein BH10PAT1_BH10PAT1_5510 [soil metagenome]